MIPTVFGRLPGYMRARLNSTGMEIYTWVETYLFPMVQGDGGLQNGLTLHNDDWTVYINTLNLLNTYDDYLHDSLPGYNVITCIYAIQIAGVYIGNVKSWMASLLYVAK